MHILGFIILFIVYEFTRVAALYTFHIIRVKYVSKSQKVKAVVLNLDNVKSETIPGTNKLRRIVPPMCPKCFNLMAYMDFPWHDEYFECKCEYKIYIGE